jgi:GAF domain-containing protein
MYAETELKIAQLFASIACDFAAQADVHAVSDRIVHVTGNVIECPWSQVLQLTRQGTLTCRQPSDPTLAAALRISSEEHEGVVSEAVTGGGTIVVEDFESDDRWTDYRRRILAETPIRSALVYVLRIGQEDLGALAMYSPEVGYFTSARQETAAVLADLAAVALSHASAADRANNLEIALSTNRRIGMAVGVLMARLQITDEEAFTMLRTTSQHAHIKLREVAEYVTMTGDLPPVPLAVAVA